MDPSAVTAIASTGAVLSIAQKAALSSSLPLLKKNYKFSQILFWGKLAGMTADYLLALGILDDWKGMTYLFYSMDGCTWGQLPVCTPEQTDLCAKLPVDLMLTGDASHEYTLPAEPVPEGEEEVPPPTVSEEVRLSYMVAAINAECAMAPKGALAMRASGAVAPSPTFAGLSEAAALDIGSYVFVNKPKPVSVLTPAAEVASDFLLPATSIVPKGALVARLDEGSECVVVRSLLWPGFTAFTKPGTSAWGYCYFGNGVKNGDIAFMLP